MERANGIEPSSLDWKSKVITIIRRPQLKFNYYNIQIKKSKLFILLLLIFY